MGFIIRIYHDVRSPKRQIIHICHQHHVFLALGTFVKKYTANRFLQHTKEFEVYSRGIFTRDIVIFCWIAAILLRPHSCTHFSFISLIAVIWNDMIYLLTAIWLTPAGSRTIHIYTQTVHRTTKWSGKHRTYITIILHKHIN